MLAERAQDNSLVAAKSRRQDERPSPVVHLTASTRTWELPAAQLLPAAAAPQDTLYAQQNGAIVAGNSTAAAVAAAASRLVAEVTVHAAAAAAARAELVQARQQAPENKFAGTPVSADDAVIMGQHAAAINASLVAASSLLAAMLSAGSRRNSIGALSGVGFSDSDTTSLYSARSNGGSASGATTRQQSGFGHPARQPHLSKRTAKSETSSLASVTDPSETRIAEHSLLAKKEELESSNRLGQRLRDMPATLNSG